MITPISLIRMPFIQNKNNTAQKAMTVTFCARPEYDYYEKHCDVRASNFFRRGQGYGPPSKAFKDIAESIKLLLSENQKPKILIAGLGQLQEPLSFLAIIKSLKNGKSFDSVVDLNCVDLQPKISDEDLVNYSYLDSTEKPMFARKSFDYIEHPTYKRFHHYKVKPEIFKFLKGVLNNPEKTKWDTKIQEFASTCPEQTYHMISINNTLMYIDDLTERQETVENLSKMLKKGGILITEPYDGLYKEIYSCLKDFKNLKPGIWQKMI